MKYSRRIFFSCIIAVTANLGILLPYLTVVKNLHISNTLKALIAILGIIVLICLVIRPKRSKRPTKALRALNNGCELLHLFLISATITFAAQLYLTIWVFDIMLPWDGFGSGVILATWLFSLLTAVIVEAIVFWAGMLRLYTTSVQLGIKHRILAALVAWIPGLNIYYLLELIHVAEAEVEIETDKLELDASRAESEVCKTRYPILLVHGVFFRDFRYLNYWGRISGALKKNGAVVYYGQQQSAASVEDCGKELAERIRTIVTETGCEKVNIIAHSKGGLDSRAAISNFGTAQYVASLTTINTPHQGCISAEYLLSKIPARTREGIAKNYNAALRKLGDHDPDFLCAVNDLTVSACKARNELTPDAPGVLYESVMSYCKKAESGKFPLNVSYPLVKHFDGKNDGLVSVESARWGEHFTLIEPHGKRGISHADLIDLNRENIRGFDVREFYVSLAANLKSRGY